MRMALNQALELSTALQEIANYNLTTIIFEDSVKLALKYIAEDEKALIDGTLAKLPYITFSIDRLMSAREWGAAITETPWQFVYSVTVLRQWMAVARHQSQPHRASIAKELLRVDSLLKQHDPGNERDLEGRVRVLRREIRKLIEDIGSSLSGLKNDAFSIDRSLSERTTLLEHMGYREDLDLRDDEEVATFDGDINVGVTQSHASAQDSKTGFTVSGRLEKLFPIWTIPDFKGTNVGPTLTASGRADRYGKDFETLNRTSLEATAYLVGFRPYSHDSVAIVPPIRFFGKLGRIRYSSENESWGNAEGYEFGLGNVGIASTPALRKRGGFAANLSLDAGGLGVQSGNYLASDGNTYKINGSFTIRPEATLGYCSARGRCLMNTFSYDIRNYSLDKSTLPEELASKSEVTFKDSTLINELNVNVGRYLDNNLSLGGAYRIERENISDDFKGPNNNRVTWRQMLYLKGTL